MSKSYVSGWCRPRKRAAIYIRDGFACVYCAKDLRHVPSCAISLDHLMPKVNGGSNDPSNLVTACHSCNSERRDTPWQEYVKHVHGYNSMWRIAYIESQTRLPLNFDLVDDLFNQAYKEEKREESRSANADAKAAAAEVRA